MRPSCPARTTLQSGMRRVVDIWRHDAHVDPSPIRFAPSPGGKIAFRTLGDGPIDLVIYPSGAWNIDLALDDPRVDRWLRQLASFSRVIMWHSRGLAISDPLPLEITIEEWAQDLLYVLDAAESERAS